MKKPPELESLALGFETYLNAVYFSTGMDLDENQYEHLERSFYSGALWMFGMLGLAGMKGRPVLDNYVKSIMAEMDEYAPPEEGSPIGPKIPPEGGNRFTN